MTALGRFVDYCKRHRRAVAIDLLFVATWVILLRWFFQAQGYDNWLYYVVLFGGVVAYVALVPVGHGTNSRGENER